MAQQLNLNDPRFLPRRLPWSAVHGLWAAAGVFAASGLGGQAMQWAVSRTEADTQLVEAGTASLRNQVGKLATSPVQQSNELAQLKVTEAAQRRVRAALDAGVVGNREGHAEYLMALARQTPGSVWITGFQVSEDGNGLSLEGRMTSATALGDYLRRLNTEPRFKGRTFSQLQVRAMAPPTGSAAPVISEFQLRTQPGEGLPPAPGAPGSPPGRGSPQSIAQGPEGPADGPMPATMAAAPRASVDTAALPPSVAAAAPPGAPTSAAPRQVAMQAAVQAALPPGPPVEPETVQTVVVQARRLPVQSVVIRAERPVVQTVVVHAARLPAAADTARATAAVTAARPLVPPAITPMLLVPVVVGAVPRPAESLVDPTVTAALPAPVPVADSEPETPGTEP